MREESEEFKTTEEDNVYSGEPKQNEGHTMVIVKASSSQEPCVSQSLLIKAASQFNGTNVKRIVTSEDY